jgi:dUTPase
MTLYIYTDNQKLRNMLNDYNSSRRVTDSGFDIPCVYQTVDTFIPFYTFNLYIKVAATDLMGMPTPCLLVPRSSISNSPFRMANSIGLIDSGYRGNVQAKVDVLPQNSESPYEIQEKTRYFQLCKHDFLPWNNIVIVDNESDLPSPHDNRGEAGFGSTGK